MTGIKLALIAAILVLATDGHAGTTDKARFQKLKTGLLGELSLEVIEGLKGGESVITGPFKALREIKPGDLVKVEKPKQKDGSPR